MYVLGAAFSNPSSKKPSYYLTIP